MDSDRRAGHLDALVRELRARLLEEAGRAPGSDSRADIRALVDTAAGMLDERTRDGSSTG